LNTLAAANKRSALASLKLTQNFEHPHVKYFMELGKITGKPYVYDLLLNKVVPMESFVL